MMLVPVYWEAFFIGAIWLLGYFMGYLVGRASAGHR